MPWYVILIVALASIALVVAVLAWLGLKAWRLAKHGAAVSRHVTPLADGLRRRADEASAAAERLSTDGEQLVAGIAHMQRSLARLQVVARSLNDALHPYYVISGWLSGERGWGDLGI